VATDAETEDLAGAGLGFGGIGGQLDPARLAASADQDLRLDDDLAAELLGPRARLLRRPSHPPLGYGDAEAGEELLPLVLVEIHAGPESIRAYPSASTKTQTGRLTCRSQRSWS
jgi:hypothetical protein